MSHIKRALTTTAWALASILSTGCATIIHGGFDQAVTVTSEPSGAEFRVDPEGVSGTTPATVYLAARRNHVVTAKAGGHKQARAEVRSRFSKWMFGNVLFGGLIGVVIDLCGGGYYLTPDAVHIKLEEDGPVAQ